MTIAFNECFQTDADSGYGIVQLMRNKSDDIILESADLIFIGDIADKDRQSLEHMMVIAAKMNCQSWEMEMSAFSIFVYQLQDVILSWRGAFMRCWRRT